MRSALRAHLRPALVLILWASLLTGVAYPLVVTGIAHACFPHEAEGSLVVRGGRVVGSELLGQSFTSPRYLWGRPSATNPPCDAGASSGSNLGPNNPALANLVASRIAAPRAADPGSAEPIPVELVSASGSGLDPHVSPAAARFQAARIARARGWPVERVLAVIERLTQGRSLGALGEPRVSVLRVNLALDDLGASGAR